MASKREIAMKESSLPYSFVYKIRHAFYGKQCPICGCKMQIDREFGCRNRIPSLQHNTPISLGGKHELGNISVICRQCNVTIKAHKTGELNAKEVIKVWQTLNG